MWMSQLILFNKPYRVLSQFTDRDSASAPRDTLARYLNAPGFRAAGRLDYDSEGLLILTADGNLQQRIAHPKNKQWKTYWVQVEGQIDSSACAALAEGVTLKDGRTRPARARPSSHRKSGLVTRRFGRENRSATPGWSSPSPRARTDR